MLTDFEKAQIIWKLIRKNNWGNCYDRLEHFKRFPNLNEAIKELNKKGWILIHKKSKFIGISLDTSFKREIIEFIEREIPYVGGEFS